MRDNARGIAYGNGGAMKRYLCALAVLLAAHQARAETAKILGPNAEACAADAAGPAALVHVHGFKDRTGQLRVELYPANNADFLAPGGRLRSEGKVFQRIDLPTPQEGDPDVCVALPAPGEYAIVVLHDRNSSGKLDPFSDGYGFPNNPRLGFSKPDVSVATFTSTGLSRLDVVLNYWTGLSSRPLQSR